MDLVDNLATVSLRQETVLTIGAFDGVHLGHQALIDRIVRRARATDRFSALITFHPHPVAVLKPELAPKYLTTPGEKAALLEGLGLDILVLLPFDLGVAATPAGDFMRVVSQQLRVWELWVGADFALGRNREGDADRLWELGQDLGYRLELFQPVLYSGERISSRRIRALLQEGDVEAAADRLGRYPSLSGRVVVGAQRGRELGFPTANLEIRPERAVPADGVYAVFASLGSDRYPAVANVGVRPSFDNGQRTVETHLFDFDHDIYDCDLVVEFVARLRSERKFLDIADLVSQIHEDSAMARQILASTMALGGYSHSVLPITPPVPGRGYGQGEAGSQGPAACGYRAEEIEHTADRALRVWGKQLSDLFIGAMRGMYGLMASLDAPPAESWRQIEIEGLDQESLLVDWLNELLFFTETEGLLFVEAQISTLTPTRLVARVGGVSSPITKAGVKAATFHDLAISRDGDGWSAVITFDV